MRKLNIITLIVSVVLIISSCNSNQFEKENDAVFKSIQKIYTLHTDGSINYHYKHELKYITHYSFNRLYGESFIIYNPNEQKIKINTAETKTEDGRIVESPENAFNKVLPRFAAGVPAFNHLREMVVTHTGLELGCVVNFDYEIKSNKTYLPFLNDNIVLQEKVPVENMEIIVNVPEGATLNYKLLNVEEQVKKTKKDGYTQYTWYFKDMPGLPTDAYQAHDGAALPRLIFSNVSLNDALTTLTENADLSLSHDMKQFARKRVTEKEKGIQMVRELQKIVGTEMNSFHIPLEYTAYSVRPLQDIWKSNGGTDLEKILLLNELIKYNGIESKVLLDVSTETYSDQIGNLKNAGHFYILTHTEGEEMIFSVNPKQKNNLAILIKNDVLVDLQGKIVKVPDFISDLEGGCVFKGNFELSDSGNISGKVNAKVSGFINPYFNYLVDAENAKEIIASLFPAKEIADVVVLHFDNKQSTVKATIASNDVWKSQGDYYFIETPTSSYGIRGEHLSTLLEERQTPLHLSQKINELYDFSISIPENFEFVSQSIQKEISNESGTAKIEISATEKEIHIVKELKINSQDIPVSEYGEFKELVDLWTKKTYSEIILKKVTDQ